MGTKLAKLSILAGLVVALGATPAEAFGRRHATTSYYYPRYPIPTWPHDGCCVYRVSEPAENLHPPYSGKLRVVKLHHGAIVEINAPTGTNPQPTGTISVIQTGPGEVKYEGYNSCATAPGKPGAPIRWSIFFCPTKVGKTSVKVGFVMSDNTIVNVPLEFEVIP
ncbi:hypothetical protein VT84_06565 [Gemmata sp. SH-PL17]|uniref:hypothetical protein n=1 Tax=Gemmata sp. SH-PL17 TaxID=1630693 RepID=UPI00078B8E34|nr:hypothetical protein [Gemmata sp. SH-PL17]AMV24040.1 hypothetical protein VT84_06565 [Gemmata sp. SH-PL17]